MRRWAEFVLRHRKAVVGFWGIVLVAGIVLAGKTTSRLTIDFSLPGQPGTETAHKIKQAFGNGGDTNPYIVTVTVPSGQTVAGHEAEVERAFTSIADNVPNVRVIDEADTGDKAFRTKDDRTAYALVFYRFNPSPTQTLLTDPIRAAATKAAPPGATIGVTGEDILSSGGDSNSGPGVLGETLLGAVGALAVLAFVFGSFLALLPLLIAAVSILFTFELLLPITYVTDVSFIVQFLVALVGLGVAIDYSLMLVTRWREERDHGRDNHDAVVVAMETAGQGRGLQRRHGGDRPAGAGRAAGAVHAQHGLRRRTHPARQRAHDAEPDAGHPRRHRAAGRLAQAAPREPGQPRLEPVGDDDRPAPLGGGDRGALAALAALIGVFFGIKIGLASSDSLAKNGPAYEALADPREGRRLDRHADPDGGAGQLRPGPAGR